MKKSILTVTVAIFLFGSVFPVSAIIPNDSQYSQQENMWASVNAPMAWDITTGSKTAVVAIIDTGVDSWHPDLAGNIWINQFEVPGNNADDDRNGYVDDINGWNFIENNNDARTSVFNADDEPEAVRHGTVAAGLIGAVGNNNRDGAGVNWQVSIMPLRAVRSDGYGLMSDVAEAILYAVNNGADVISMSMVSAYSDVGLQRALRLAYEQGVVIVASAGNRHIDLGKNPNYPVCYDLNDAKSWILGVGGLSSSTPDKLASFSDYGACVDLLAPGSGVYSTERYAPSYGYANSFGGPWDGTSFAAPIVAGAAALLKSAHPEWRPDKIISILKSTADNVDSNNPTYGGMLGAGRVNIGAAMARAVKEVSYRGVDLSRLFFIFGEDKNELGRFDLSDGKSRILGNIWDARILDMARLGNRPGGREYLALLLGRDKYNYVRFFDGEGRKLKEIALSSISDPVAVAKKIVWRASNLTVEYLNSKTKTSYLVDYNLSGEKIRELEIKNLVNFDAETKDGYLATAISIGKSKLEWQLYDNANQKIKTGVWNGYDSLVDLRLGYFWGEVDPQISAVLKKGKVNEWKIIDTASIRSDIQILPTDSSAYITVPGLYRDRPAFFVYATGAGTYRFYDGHAGLLFEGKF
ncbi:MAG: hypothetical protein A3J93_04455 [Candidatus Magasanikbacteria bacterium RIFOXYC2_FULL_42_28]|uniref:Peptidase S8/S53 domain-containing protein n=1 Tax=Candidatus Magasanikbacteria bacterium RIFOXYC2_FULL_42_28 TaxID=1798704 RepID=A0A1F6NX30_9BACT|nr:MAG: hypothetical protein A3J93_04455 [Candidatus Magasanikbacteria bacterium RIFOXYC2_FULL_42_28]